MFISVLRACDQAAFGNASSSTGLKSSNTTELLEEAFKGVDGEVGDVDIIFQAKVCVVVIVVIVFLVLLLLAP
uniref:EF-hand domain-containing protein n=1 Tax=Steinernema glaseri TaxID=37863 RepID=A0A1I7YF13_9BILA